MSMLRQLLRAEMLIAAGFFAGSFYVGFLRGLGMLP